MNQSEIEAKTCNRHQARESGVSQVTISFGFIPNWSRNNVLARTGLSNNENILGQLDLNRLKTTQIHHLHYK